MATSCWKHKQSRTETACIQSGNSTWPLCFDTSSISRAQLNQLSWLCSLLVTVSWCHAFAYIHSVSFYHVRVSFLLTHSPHITIQHVKPYNMQCSLIYMIKHLCFKLVEQIVQHNLCVFAAQVCFCLIDAINCEIKLQYSQLSCIVSGHCMYQPLACCCKTDWCRKHEDWLIDCMDGWIWIFLSFFLV